MENTQVPARQLCSIRGSPSSSWKPVCHYAQWMPGHERTGMTFDRELKSRIAPGHLNLQNQYSNHKKHVDVIWILEQQEQRITR